MPQSGECLHGTICLLLKFLLGIWRVRVFLPLCPRACTSSHAPATHDREHPVTLRISPMNLVRLEVLVDHFVELVEQRRVVFEERGAKRRDPWLEPV